MGRNQQDEGLGAELWAEDAARAVPQEESCAFSRGSGGQGLGSTQVRAAY